MTPVFASIPLACPLDGLPLLSENKSYRCSEGHTYDQSRQGYLNLLPVQLKASKDPGDSKHMVDSRRTVLEAGHYAPLAENLSELVCELVNLNAGKPQLIVDAGCGDGYYTALIHQNLAQQFSTRVLSTAEIENKISVMGIDISKPAVLAAAKKYKHIPWAVATNKKLPLLDASIDIITSLFGFETWVPWSEQQTSGQLVVVVDAAPMHLIEIRNIVYEDARVHDVPDDNAALAAGYIKTDQRSISWNCHIEQGNMLTNILQMTPHVHRVSEEAMIRLGKTNKLSLTLEATIRVYAKS